MRLVTVQLCSLAHIYIYEHRRAGQAGRADLPPQLGRRRSRRARPRIHKLRASAARGGGTAWDSIVYDAVNDQILVCVGNGSSWNAKIRDPDGNGDNLFLSPIPLLDADKGTYRWHYQTTPRAQWGYTATQQLILTERPSGKGSEDRRVVMQAPKNGFSMFLMQLPSI